MPRISQSSLIAFYMLAAFIVFVTVRGELSTYVGFFVGGSAAAPIPESTTATATDESAKNDKLSQAQDILLTAAQLAILV